MFFYRYRPVTAPNVMIILKSESERDRALLCAVPGLGFTQTQLKIGRAGLKRLSYVSLR